MSNTLLSPLTSLHLSDNDISPATATLCRWHPQPPRPPKPRSFSTPARGPRHARQPKSPIPLPIHADSSVRAPKSRRTAPEIPIDRHRRRRILPRGFLLRGFSDACLRAAPRAVTGRHPKTLNETGPLRRRRRKSEVRTLPVNANFHRSRAGWGIAGQRVDDRRRPQAHRQV